MKGRHSFADSKAHVVPSGLAPLKSTLPVAETTGSMIESFQDYGNIFGNIPIGHHFRSSIPQKILAVPDKPVPNGGKQGREPAICQAGKPFDPEFKW